MMEQCLKRARSLGCRELGERKPPPIPVLAVGWVMEASAQQAQLADVPLQRTPGIRVRDVQNGHGSARERGLLWV